MKKVRKQVRRKETNAERKQRRLRIDTERRTQINDYRKLLIQQAEDEAKKAEKKIAEVAEVSVEETAPTSV